MKVNIVMSKGFDVLGVFLSRSDAEEYAKSHVGSTVHERHAEEPSTIRDAYSTMWEYGIYVDTGDVACDPALSTCYAKCKTSEVVGNIAWAYSDTPEEAIQLACAERERWLARKDNRGDA